MERNISKTYLVTDTHFSHTRIITHFGFRPPNFNQLIINQWQATVQPQDIVYHLGDVTWGSQGELMSIMAGLPGTKILIRGNHDKNHSNNWFIQAGFAAVLEKAQISGVILSHIPAIMNEAEIERGLINVHGHFHNNNHRKWEKYLVDRITDNHFLLALEDVEYRPVSLDAVKRGKYVKNSKKVLESESVSGIK